MKKLFLISFLALYCQAATAQNKPKKQKEPTMEEARKEAQKAMENLDPETKKMLEQMGVMDKVKELGIKTDNGTSKEKNISAADKTRIAKAKESLLPDSIITTGGNDSYIVRSTNDFRLVKIDEEYAAFLTENNDFIGNVAAKPVSFAQAIARAQVLCKGKLPAAELTKLKVKAPQGKAAAIYWQNLAAIQAMAGGPEASFCLLLLAYEADGSNTGVLSDLAGALAMLRQANESLAILDEISKRGIMPTPPMELSAADVLGYTRCYNQMLTGNTGSVRTTLESIAERQPLLAEAKRLLALLDEKEGKDGKPRFLRAQSRMNNSKFCGTYPGERPGPGEQTYSLDLRRILNKAKGIRGQLPIVKYPQTPEEAAIMREPLLLEHQKNTAKQTEFARRQSEHQAKLQVYVSDFSTQQTWGSIVEDFISTLDWRDADIRELDENIRKRQNEWNEISLAVGEQRDKCIAACKNGDRSCARECQMRGLSRYKPHVDAIDRAIREYYAEWAFMATMLAAEVGDENWHRQIEFIIEVKQHHLYSLLQAMALSMTNFGLDPSYGEDVSATLNPEKPGKCDDNKTYSFSLETPDKSFGTGLSFNCKDGVGFEVTAGKLSAELTLNQNGGYTIFVGPKIGAGIGGAGGQIKGGGYVSGQVQGGTIDEVGVKAQATVSAGAGPVSVSSTVYESAYSFSFVPGL